MTASVLSRIEPLPTDVTEPTYGYTDQQLDDLKVDAARAGHRQGFEDGYRYALFVHGIPFDPTDRLPTVHPTT